MALARILLEPANLLLLDEPTHHLDLAGKEVLEDALEQYPGALVVVTHDRSLMARLATRVLEVSGARVTLYPGGYDDYEQTRLARERAGGPGAAGVPASPGAARAPARPGPPARRKRGSRTPAAPQGGRQKREKEAARIERDLEAREARLKALEAQLADPAVYHDGPQAKQLVTEYERLRAEVESLWQRLGELA